MERHHNKNIGTLLWHLSSTLHESINIKGTILKIWNEEISNSYTSAENWRFRVDCFNTYLVVATDAL